MPGLKINHTGRLVFAHQLRGIAALLIVITHYFGTFYGAQGFVSAVTFSPDLHLAAPSWVHYMDFPYLKGPFGVAVFFLISGFVIPFSLEEKSAPRFLLARFFRIFPTYFVSLGLSMAALYLGSRYWGTHFGHSAGAMACNGLLVHNLLGIGSIDPINWTLSIEIKFYLLAALLAPVFIRRDFVYFALFVALALGSTALLQHWQEPGPVLATLTMELNYVLFMLIGVVFYQHIRSRISTLALAARSLFILAVFALNWSIGPQREQFEIVTVYYVYAYCAFFAAYLARGWFRPVRVLDFLADISYPLYITHSLIGFLLLKVFIHAGLPFPAAVCIALAVVIALSYALHRIVEMPSNAAGKRLAEARPLSTA
jgi:peptidoglycan/LPS O-acetylase OafA/YrhL